MCVYVCVCPSAVVYYYTTTITLGASLLYCVTCPIMTSSSIILLAYIHLNNKNYVKRSMLAKIKQYAGQGSDDKQLFLTVILRITL